MQLKRPSTARVLASQIKKVTRSRSKTENSLICLIVFLLVLIVLAEVLTGHSDDEGRGVGALHAQKSPFLDGERTLRKMFAGNGDSREHISAGVPLEPSSEQEPQLEIFLQRIRNALAPYTKKYVNEVPVADLASDENTCKDLWSSRRDDYAFQKCSEPCSAFDTLKAAKASCTDLGDLCAGVTQIPSGKFETRGPSASLQKSSVGERSWKKVSDVCKKKDTAQKATARKVWDAFHDIVDASLEDDSLNLMKDIYGTKEDGSMFVSIAAYRDHTCRFTLRKAFQRAKFPEKLSVGIVQQNCVHPTKCMTGTGWANTRRWVSSDGPDPDCAEEFCSSELGRPHCEAGRVRILRLDEIDSLGPFFTRFVNSKMWRGENFYMQIDAHTDFRQDWDESLVAQMRATKSYPYSVISNYPPGGTPSDQKMWPALSEPTTPDGGAPSALCACTFENAGGEHMTVRLSQTGRNIRSEKSRPRRSLFVAAGFFIAHGSIVNNVGFDPFLPFLFMGEEIALSVRFYTSGYDIYGPSAEVLRHEYVRKESPKFWESVGQVYSAPNIHNYLTDLIVQRVQNLVRFPEADSEDKINPQSLLTMLDRFGLGNLRTVDKFLEISQMDLVKKRQTTPDWCIQGDEPAEEKKTKRRDVDVDLLHR